MNSLLFQRALHQLLDIGIFFGEHTVRDNGDLRSETLVCLRHLDSDWTSPDDGHRLRQRIVIEDRLVGNERHFAQAWNRWNERVSAGGNQERVRTDQPPANAYG